MSGEQVSALPAAAFAGSSDGLQRLWTPHRMAYIDGDAKVTSNASEQCPFCEVPQGSDEDGLIVARGVTAFVVLNLFPYNSGHLLVCPHRHVADFTELTRAEREEIGVLTARAMEVIRHVYSPQGFNLGMNQGSAAGAGIAAHLHQHVVPRWSGDANFFPIIAETKALPELLSQTRDKLSQAWDSAPHVAASPPQDSVAKGPSK